MLKTKVLYNYFLKTDALEIIQSQYIQISFNRETRKSTLELYEPKHCINITKWVTMRYEAVAKGTILDFNANTAF